MVPKKLVPKELVPKKSVPKKSVSKKLVCTKILVTKNWCQKMVKKNWAVRVEHGQYQRGQGIGSISASAQADMTSARHKNVSLHFQ